MSLKNLTQTRSELRGWGYFWSNRKYSVGGSDKSICAVFIEKKRSETVKTKRSAKNVGVGEDRNNKLKGIDVPYDVVAKESRVNREMTSDDIRIPLYVKIVDDIIETLNKQ